MPVSTAEPNGSQSLDEFQRTVLWRLAQLSEAGYDDESALVLALEDIDLHGAVELLKRGCSAGTALRILL